MSRKKLKYHSPWDGGTLCSMLAVELVSFPIESRDEINGIFWDNENWIEKLIEQGKESGVMDDQVSSREQSHIITAFVQGAHC